MSTIELGLDTFGDVTVDADGQPLSHARVLRDVVAEAELAPATADLLAKMAGGHADDLASAVLLATDRPILAAPAMNPRMWLNPATRRNVAQLEADGVRFVGPNVGEMAEPGEAGPGRLAEPLEIIAAIDAVLRKTGPAERKPLAGLRVLVTSGPTHEPIDPVRYIANRSSGKQGHAIATAAARLGASVTLVAGPTSLPTPLGIRFVQVETAEEMLAAVRAALPADIAVFAAAVADWRIAKRAEEKIKKGGQDAVPTLELVENPDILKTVAAPGPQRPALVIGFAAETDDVVAHAQAKRLAKGCDWIVANDVSPATGVMGGERNTVYLVTEHGVESWPPLGKEEVADRLVRRAAEHLRSLRTASRRG
jgi:phosphopantothenoylcysteine decarboxylase/phosphopantothenate--cysteine ligase